MVSIVVLSIGVLGAVGMQLASLQASKEVRFQAVAGSMARELAEKMRGNHAVAIQLGNPYLISTTLARTATVSTPNTNCYTGPCSAPIDIARWDMADWQSRLRDALPAPRVEICFDDAPYDSAGAPRWACNSTPTSDVVVMKLAWTRADSRGELVTAGSASAVPLLVLPLTSGSPE